MTHPPTSTKEIDAKITHINEQIAMFFRREKIPAALLSRCVGVGNVTCHKMAGARSTSHTLTLLPLVKVLDFLGYDITFVKRADEKTIWDNPEKVLILKQKQHDLKTERAARNARRDKGPKVIIKHPRSTKAARYESARQDAQAKRQDGLSMFD